MRGFYEEWFQDIWKSEVIKIIIIEGNPSDDRIEGSKSE